MMELHVFGPGLGLPDPSPFCLKAIILMEMSGLPYQRVRGDMRKAPKGKLPVLVDGDRTIPDSTFIRLHLEQKYGIDFDKGLEAAERGANWAVEKMLEDHLYWQIVQERWLDPANFEKGPRHFFTPVPAPLRPLVIAMVKRKLVRSLHGQGMGRYSAEERRILAERGVEAMAGVLGDKPYLGGTTPCGADATLGGFLMAGLCPLFDSRLRDAIERHPNLVAHAKRIEERYFGDGASGKAA